MAILDNIFGKKNDSKKDTVVSKQVDADIIDSLKYVDNLCNNSMNIQKSKLEEEKRLLKSIELLDQFKKYDDIDDQDIEEIETLMDKYVSLGKEKENLKSDLLLNEKKYEDFRKYEDTIENSLKELREFEEDKEKLDNDLKYLKAEQGALKFEEESLISKFKTVEKLFYSVLLSVCVLIIVFSTLYFIFGETIILPATIVAILFVFWIMWIFMIEGDLKLEHEKNKVKQEKIVKMINKVKIKIVNAEAALLSIYKKFGVNSSLALKNKWDIYRTIKNKRLQYNEVFTDYFDIYEQIEKILSKYHIRFDNEMSVLKELTDKKEKMRLKEDTEREIIVSKKKIEKFESEQVEIINKLEMIRENDDSETKSVTRIIDAYLEQFENGIINMQDA